MELLLWALTTLSAVYVAGVFAAAIAWDRGAKTRGWGAEKGKP
jgi:hypothetical protein